MVWHHWSILISLGSSEELLPYLIRALKPLQQTESTYSSFSAVRIVMLQFHSVSHADKPGEPASSAWRVALAQIGEEYLTAGRQLEENENLTTLDLNSWSVYIFGSKYCPILRVDRFLRDFFGITKYLVVFYYCFSFQSCNCIYGMKGAFLSPSSLFYFMVVHKDVSLLLVLVWNAHL